MLSKNFKLSILTLGALLSTQAFADSGFKVPVHYNIELVDGQSDPDSYSRFSRTVTLAPGKHQIVVAFKDTFKTGSDSRIVQAIDPLVINIEDLKKDQVVTFQYKRPTNEDQAKRYVHQQKVTLSDTSGKILSSADASYFILTSEKGFSLMRDYKDELSSLGRLYAPSSLSGTDTGLEMTDYGSPTIRAGGSSTQQVQTQGLTLEPMGANTSAMSTTTVGSKADAATYQSLVNMYEKADDATKLKFVKYVMAH